MVKNKRGWIRIVEVFIAILLLASLTTMIIRNEKSIQEKSKSEEIYKEQETALEIIRLNETLREKILKVTVPIESTEAEFPLEINNTLRNTISNYLECYAKICNLNSECNLKDKSEKETYVASAVIFANNEEYNPKELKLFCWRR